MTNKTHPYTRRKAIQVVAGGGITGLLSVVASDRLSNKRPTGMQSNISRGDFRTIQSVAEVVCPSPIRVNDDLITLIVEFIPETRHPLLSTTCFELNEYSLKTYGAQYYQIDSVPARDKILRQLGVHRVHSNSTGLFPQRVRYHLVNTILYVIFTHPVGSSIVGQTNPVGFAGGFAKYQSNKE